MENSTTRKPWIAVVLTFLTLGLGHVYSGEAKKGVVFYLLFMGVSFGMGSIVLLPLPFALNVVVPLVILLMLFVYILIDALSTARKWKEGYVRKGYNKWYVYLAIILTARFVINPSSKEFLRSLLIQAYKMPSGASLPTLLIGDHFFVNRFVYGPMIPFTNHKLFDGSKPQRGEIVVFLGPTQRRKDFVKRVVGLPGETIQIKERQVYIDGEPLAEKGYVYYSPPSYVPILDSYGPLKIPEDCYFMMGDNRHNSADSRVWGPVPYNLIKGKAYQIYWSWDAPHRRVRWSRIGKRIE